MPRLTKIHANVFMLKKSMKSVEMQQNEGSHHTTQHHILHSVWCIYAECRLPYTRYILATLNYAISTLIIFSFFLLHLLCILYMQYAYYYMESDAGPSFVVHTGKYDRRRHIACSAIIVFAHKSQL